MNSGVCLLGGLLLLSGRKAERCYSLVGRRKGGGGGSQQREELSIKAVLKLEVGEGMWLCRTTEVPALSRDKRGF